MSIRLEGDGWVQEIDEDENVRGMAPKRIVILKPVSPEFFKKVICPMLLVEGVELYLN